MIPHTPEFDAALINSHQMAVRVDIQKNGQTLIEDLAISDGQVEIDGNAKIRRQCDLRLYDPTGTMSPAQFGDIFSGSGEEAVVYRGIKFPDGTEELIPLGVFGLKGSVTSDTGEYIQVSSTGFDRSRRVARARFTNSFTIPSATVAGTAIENILLNRYPQVEFAQDLTYVITNLLPQTVFDRASDPWADAVVKIANDCGYDIFFNHLGQIDVKLLSSAQTIPDWTYQEGPEATMLSLDKTIDNDQGVNHWIVTGESTDGTTPPVWAEAKDNDPTSPTYYLGDYGDVPEFYSSQLITTTAQAQAAADRRLQQTVGATQQIHFNAIVNPTHDANDMIGVVRERISLNDFFWLTSITIPLVAVRAMEAGTHRKTF